MRSLSLKGLGFPRKPPLAVHITHLIEEVRIYRGENWVD